MAAVLPGVREFRTPFVAGCLWTAVAMVLVQIVDPSAYSNWPLAMELRQIVERLPSSAALGILAFSVYLLGVFATAISSFLDRNAPRRYGLSGRKVNKSARNNGLKLSYLRDAVREQLSDYPAAVREVAFELVIVEYDIADVSLASKSTDQFQEYDRVRSEAEFRRAAWLPILILALQLSILAPSLGSIVVTLVGLLIGAVLFVQAKQKRLEASDRLASAMYFGLATTPLFDSLVHELERRSDEVKAENKSPYSADYYAWVTDFLAVRQLWEQMPRFLLQIETEEQLQDSLDKVGWRTWSALCEHQGLTHFLAVAYANVRRFADGVDRVVVAEDLIGKLDSAGVVEGIRRINKHLSWEVQIGNIASGEIDQAGVLAVISKSEQRELKGELSDVSWQIASEILDGWRDRRHRP
ncbi:hypothetical protein [Isoptericola sp. QY 916]|uniref:hypothetical protein n=1 Tax=Isoptericola sp. QY 916 TaxID=2782570 RepID=UPI003D300713|nr:hypothetical protein [Isoptericola sp. QY 916]